MRRLCFRRKFQAVKRRRHIAGCLYSPRKPERGSQGCDRERVGNPHRCSDETRLDRGDNAVCQAETLRRVPRSTRSLTVLTRMLAGPVECAYPDR